MQQQNQGQNSNDAYYAEVRNWRSQLPPTTFITSVRNWRKGTTAGAVCEVNRETAALRLADETHVLSTPEEIAQFKAEQSARDQECQRIGLERKQQTVVVVQANDPLVGALASAQPEKPAAKKG